MIEEELVDYLNLNSKTSELKDRNIDIVTYFYGFSVSIWPTLEETAKAFGDVTRERIRQVINKNFRNKVKIEDLPSVKKCIAILEEQNFWQEADLIDRLKEAELVSTGANLRGILNLIQDLSSTNSYDIYSPDLNKISRKDLDNYPEKFIFEENLLKKYSALLKMVNNLPGTLGVANLNFLKPEINDFDLCAPILKALIRAKDKSWIFDDGDNFWYLFEDRDNRLINYFEKTFNTIEASDVGTLSEVYRNAMTGRSTKFEYPPIQIIEKYISTSRFLNIEKNIATFLGNISELSEIEIDIYEYLKEKTSVTFPEFKAYLLAKKYSDAHINKVVTASPIVYVDRSKGRAHFQYSLVPGVAKPINVNSSMNRYNEYLYRLRKIEELGTDATVLSKTRKEQTILSGWLFDGITECDCAICGESYHVKALITAHKKKRSICNEAERLDPYIVMPLCIFGCDYLYESKVIYILDGIIEFNQKSVIGKAETRRAKELSGRKLDGHWLKGSKEYFLAPDNM